MRYEAHIVGVASAPRVGNTRVRTSYGPNQDGGTSLARPPPRRITSRPARYNRIVITTNGISGRKFSDGPLKNGLLVPAQCSMRSLKLERLGRLFRKA